MNNGSYTIPIAGEWSLEDLYVFPRAYEQCYFMYFALMSDDLGTDLDRIGHAYEAFPWQGGYSAVGFYNQLKWAVPKRQRPQIIRIEYASPGLIEIGAVVAVAVAIEKIVISLCGSARNINSTYNEIYRDLQERKLLKIKTEAEIRQLKKSELRVIDSHAIELGEALDVDVDALNQKTGSPFKSLKIILSLYRRLRKLAEFQKRGKTRL